MVHMYISLVFVLVLCYIGLIHLLGRKLLVSARVFNISTVGYIMFVYLVLFLNGNSYVYRFNEMMVLVLLLFAVFLYLLFLFFSNKDKYLLINSTIKENRLLIEDYLNMQGISFKNEENIIFLCTKHEGKIEYSASSINLKECCKPELKRGLVEHLKTKGRYGSKNIKVGIFVLFSAVALLLIIFYMVNR